MSSNLADLILELNRFKSIARELKEFNAAGRTFLNTAASGAPAQGSLRNCRKGERRHRETGPQINAAGRAGVPPSCGALSFAYLQFKVIDALQPHPSYENDDGFQPMKVILPMRFEEDPQAEKALAELRSADLSLKSVADDLAARNIIVKTAYEPCNGDVMIGLAENLWKREAAHRERKNLIEDFARKYRLRLRWNGDGTGYLETSAGRVVQPSTCVWTLLSYLYALRDSIDARPGALH